jgi:hypothetical protein
MPLIADQRPCAHFRFERGCLIPAAPLSPRRAMVPGGGRSSKSALPNILDARELPRPFGSFRTGVYTDTGS